MLDDSIEKKGEGEVMSSKNMFISGADVYVLLGD
jgi:hypothetical protein